MWNLVLYLVMAFAVISITHLMYRFVKPKRHVQLPPGSMGYLVVGETLPFLKQLSKKDIVPFVKTRVSRYGPLFRTSLFGLKMIVSTDPEVSFEIIKREKIFVFEYPKSIFKIFGEANLFTEGKNNHKYVKNLALRFFGLGSLKERLIQEIDRTTREHFRKAAKNGSVEVKELAVSMITDCIGKKMTNDMEPEAARELEENWKSLSVNWFQLPFSIPGTTLHKTIQAREKAISMIKEMLKKKRASSKRSTESFLDTMLEELEKEDSFLDEERAVNLIFIFSLVSHETTSAAIKAAVKFLLKHPEAVAELKKEHERIVKNKANPESGITWEEYKSMNFTHMVIRETLRLTSSSTFTFRKCCEDVEIGGYTIPAGWHIMMPTYVHFDPNVYKDPFSFNPWRWEGKELHAASKTYMAFGGGGRLCAGAEFAKLQMAIFLHYLITKYRWSLKGDADVIQGPSTQFPKEIWIHLSEIFS